MRETQMNGISEFVEKIWFNLTRMSAIVFNGSAYYLVLALLLLLSGAVLSKRRGRWVLIGTGLVLVLTTIFVYRGSTGVRTAGFLILLMALGIAGIGLAASGNRLTGCLLLTALGSMAIMLPTNSIGSRNLLPCYVLVLVCVCCLLPQVIGRNGEKKITAMAAACFVLSLAQVIPMVQGFRANERLERWNIEQAEKTAPNQAVLYDIAFDLRYTHYKAHVLDYFEERYLESVGKDPGVGLLLQCNGGEFYRISCKGTDLELQGYQDSSGRITMPLRAVVEAAGGLVDWDGGCITVQLNGTTYSFLGCGGMNVEVEWLDAQENRHRERMLQMTLDGNTYMEQSFFEEILGLDLRVDEAQRKCEIK